jgi:hypothetical protein
MARPITSFTSCLPLSTRCGSNGTRRMFASTPIAAAFGLRKPSEPPRPRKQFGLSREVETPETSDQGQARRAVNHEDASSSYQSRIPEKPVPRARLGQRSPPSSPTGGGVERDGAGYRGSSERPRMPTSMRTENEWSAPRARELGTPYNRHQTSRFPTHITSDEGMKANNRNATTSSSLYSNPRSDSESAEETNSPRKWEPTKKLTYQAMAGLRSLHAHDPKTFSKETLSQRYGISYDAVNRIIRSRYQDKKGGEKEEKIQGTKWDMNPGTSRLSPVPAVARAFGQRDQARTSSLAQTRAGDERK